MGRKQPGTVRAQDIRELAASVNRLHAALNRAAAQRRDPRGLVAYEQALAAWHAYRHEVLRLWDPEVQAHIRAGEGPWRHVALTFLEAGPWFFRSGYLSARLCRVLKQSALTPEEQQRVRQILLAAITQRRSEEFRAYVRLAIRVADLPLYEALTTACKHPEPLVRTRAGWMRNALRHHTLCPLAEHPQAT